MKNRNIVIAAIMFTYSLIYVANNFKDNLIELSNEIDIIEAKLLTERSGSGSDEELNLSWHWRFQ